jgi:hypothetical protein
MQICRMDGTIEHASASHYLKHIKSLIPAANTTLNEQINKAPRLPQSVENAYWPIN